MPTDTAIPIRELHPLSPQAAAIRLFLDGQVVEASSLLSTALLQGESPDLWNDWAVVQLSVAERALRRALLLNPAHPDAAANLGVLLFSTGKRSDAAVFLRQALRFATGAAQAHVQALLDLCEPRSSATPAPPSLDREALLHHLHQLIDEHFLKPAVPPNVFELPRAHRIAAPPPSPAEAPPPRQDAVGYTFTADWFSSNIASFWRHLKNLRGTPCSILEIGCFEGRASTWLLRNIAIAERSRLLCLDCNDQPLFWPNIRRAQGENRTEFKRGFSADILRGLPSRSYDFIYIDGGHSAMNVLQDAVLSFALAKPGAIIAFDDYLWNDPKHNQDGVPKPAIDAFTALYSRKLEVLETSYQVWLRKLSDD